MWCRQCTLRYCLFCGCAFQSCCSHSFLSYVHSSVHKYTYMIYIWSISLVCFLPLADLFCPPSSVLAFSRPFSLCFSPLCWFVLRDKSDHLSLVIHVMCQLQLRFRCSFLCVFVLNYPMQNLATALFIIPDVCISLYCNFGRPTLTLPVIYCVEIWCKETALILQLSTIFNNFCLHIMPSIMHYEPFHPLFRGRYDRDLEIWTYFCINIYI